MSCDLSAVSLYEPDDGVTEYLRPLYDCGRRIAIDRTCEIAGRSFAEVGGVQQPPVIGRVEATRSREAVAVRNAHGRRGTRREAVDVEACLGEPQHRHAGSFGGSFGVFRLQLASRSSDCLVRAEE